LGRKGGREGIVSEGRVTGRSSGRAGVGFGRRAARDNEGGRERKNRRETEGGGGMTREGGRGRTGGRGKRGGR